MSRNLSQIAICSICVIFIALLSVFAQDATLKEIVTTPYDESAIDTEEEKSNLFQDVDSFQLNQAYKTSDDNIQDSLVTIEINDGAVVLKDQL
ncbi:MAG: hypothetical protein JW956_02815 [Calditrichaceae bacterium]|nr:hypothetical protein [Calditrichaceae bacterium]